jgi:hypothetical protein
MVLLAMILIRGTSFVELGVRADGCVDLDRRGARLILHIWKRGNCWKQRGFYETCWLCC